MLLYPVEPPTHSPTAHCQLGLLCRTKGNIQLYPIDPTTGTVKGASAPHVTVHARGKGSVSIQPRDQKGDKETPLPLGKTHEKNGTLMAPVSLHHDRYGRRYLTLHGLVASSNASYDTFLLAMQFGHSNAPVLIQGETGVGKDGIAQTIHRASPRAAGPFIPLNCGALTESLAQAELFGKERGAYTGAIESSPGVLEQANGGTLFLDEVAELSPENQTRLLRVLESGEVQRLGARKHIHIDIRIVAATHKDLDREVRLGRFRQDLLFRLQVLHLRIPPLRRRKEDIAALADTILAELKHTPGITDEAVGNLERYHWPGNIRELRNVLNRAFVLARSQPVQSTHIVFPPSTAPSYSQSLKNQMNRAILRELERQQGHRDRTCRALQISRSTLYRWLRDHGGGVDTPEPEGQDDGRFFNPEICRGTLDALSVPSGSS